jgi:hypothetical protein
MPINLSGDFYPTYRAANPSFDADTFTCAERTVTRILETATTSDHPGMLLGKVQSGKTRTFISILALRNGRVDGRNAATARPRSSSMEARLSS